MPFYPALPSPTDVPNVNYAGQLGGGLALGQQIAGTAMDQQTKALALQQFKDRKTAMQHYAQTGDVGQVMMADPEFGLKLQGELRKLSSEERKEKMEALNKGADFMTKALPFVNEQNYSLFAQDAHQIPILRGLIPPAYDPNWIKNAAARTLDAKTAVAKINAESREATAGITAASRERAAGVRADATVTAASIRAAATGSKSPDYTKQLAALETKRVTEVGRINSNAEKEIAKLTGGVAPTNPEDIAAVKAIRDRTAAQVGELEAGIQRSRSILQRGKTIAPDITRLQSAYDTKATEINSMPPGLGKDTAMKQLQAWRDKHLGIAQTAPVGVTTVEEDDNED
jgi:hypothetical protein